MPRTMTVIVVQYCHVPKDRIDFQILQTVVRDPHIARKNEMFEKYIFTHSRNTEMDWVDTPDPGSCVGPYWTARNYTKI
jgi:hypothetical protein